jgi:hypothetical protein
MAVCSVVLKGTTQKLRVDPHLCLGRHAQFPGGTRRACRLDFDFIRTWIVEDGQSVAVYEYDPAVTAGGDQLTKVTASGQQPVSYAYNSDGEVTGRGGDSLVWDGRGRHSGGSFGGVTVAYGFDAAGFRRQRTAGGQTTRYLLGGTFETNGSNTVLLTDIDGPAGDLAHYAGPPPKGAASRSCTTTGTATWPPPPTCKATAPGRRVTTRSAPHWRRCPRTRRWSGSPAAGTKSTTPPAS